MAKYNILIPLPNPMASRSPNPVQYGHRMCNVYQTDDPDDCIKELAGYMLDFFPAQTELKNTTDEEDKAFMEMVMVMKEEVTDKLRTQSLLDDVVENGQQAKTKLES